MKNFFDTSREIRTNANNSSGEQLSKPAFDYLDVSPEGLTQFLKESYDSVDKISDFRFGAKKSILEYTFQFIQQLHSFLPELSPEPSNDLPSALLHVLYQLTLGNIGLCLNMLCMNYFLYEESEKWFQLAMNAFWEAKALNSKLEDNDKESIAKSEKSEKDEEIQLYKYLAMLNIGKCYFNYAMQHRRSDYSAAAERFEQIINDYSSNAEESIKNYVSSSNKFKKQWQLIVMEAYTGRLQVYRQKREYEEDLENKILNTYVKDAEDFNELYLNTNSDYTAQIHIEKAIVYRKKRLFEQSINEALKIDSFSESANLNGYSNVDGINNISSALRSLIFTESLPNFNIQKYENWLIVQLKIQASNDNLYALREYIQWHGEYLASPNANASRILAADTNTNTNTNFKHDNHNRWLSPSDAIDALGSGLDKILESLRFTPIRKQIETIHETVSSISSTSENLQGKITSIQNILNDIQCQTNSINHVSRETQDKINSFTLSPVTPPKNDSVSETSSVPEKAGLSFNLFPLINLAPKKPTTQSSAEESINKKLDHLLEYCNHLSDSFFAGIFSKVLRDNLPSKNPTLNNTSSDNFQPKTHYSLDDIDRLFDELIFYYPFDLSEKDKKAADLDKLPIKSNQNLALQYLKCVFFTRIGSYNRVLVMLESLCARPEFKYIRKGTIGLKARYMLAKSYMALGRFKDALHVLEEVRTELLNQTTPSIVISRILCKAIKEYESSNNTSGILNSLFEKFNVSSEKELIQTTYTFEDVRNTLQSKGYASDIIDKIHKQFNKLLKEYIIHENIDIRIELLYGRCLCLLGQYKQAKEDVYGSFTSSADNGSAFLHSRLNPTNPDNYPLTSEDLKQQERFYMDAMFCALHMKDREQFTSLYTAWNKPSQKPSSDKRTEIDRYMLHGYNAVFNNATTSNARVYFEKAHTLLLSCRSAEDSVYESDRESILSLSDREKELKDCEYRSAYIQTLINEWGNPDDTIGNNGSNNSSSSGSGGGDGGGDGDDDDGRATVQDKIIRFIIDMPISCPISMEAAFSIADWIAHYEKAVTPSSSENRNDYTEEEKKHVSNVRRLYESFAKCTLYPEQGASAFDALQKSPEFHYYKAQQQGRLFASLLLMYRPIRRFKTSCLLTCKKLKNDNRIGQYTRLNTLKAFLRTPAADEPAPRLRANSSSVMNDLFEGKAVFKLLTPVQTSPSNQSAQQQGSDASQYDPLSDQIERLSGFLNADLGRATYITSFVIDKANTVGAFNMWNVYGDKENGCFIQYSKDFFDICNFPPKSAKNGMYERNDITRYFISPFTDSDYPLYQIQYIHPRKNSTDRAKDTLLHQRISETISSWENFYNLLKLELPQELSDTGRDYKKYKDAVTASSNKNTKQFIESLKAQRTQQWKTFFEDLPASAFSTQAESSRARKTAQYLLSFAADRLNELRYLFKTDDYQYENEYRLFIASNEHLINTQLDIPCTYVEINRPLENLSVILGSKIPALDVVHLTAWMKQTQRVVHVHQSSINRP